MIKIIAAVSDNGVIGVADHKGSRIPWHYSSDMKHFKKMTTDSVVVMGRKTFESMGRKPLPNRENVVISSHKIDVPNVKWAASLDREMMEQQILIRDSHKDVWLIGGASIYEEGMFYASEIHLSVVPDIIKYPDSINHPHVIKFPWINPLKFKISEIKNLNDDDEVIKYCIYRRVISW
jgi:dihydrofolate reductase